MPKKALLIRDAIDENLKLVRDEDGTDTPLELAKTKASLLAKQEDRLKATLQEQETKIQEMMKGPSTNTKPSK